MNRASQATSDTAVSTRITFQQPSTNVGAPTQPTPVTTSSTIMPSTSASFATGYSSTTGSSMHPFVSIFTTGPTAFVGDSNSYNNYAAQAFRLNDFHPAVQNFLQSLPSEWLERASAEQIHALSDEVLGFSDRMLSALTLNPPSVYNPPVIAPTTPDKSNTATPIYSGTPYRSDPYRRTDEFKETTDSHWYNSISLPNLVETIPLIQRGYNTFSDASFTFATEGGTSIVGEGAIASLEGAAEVVGAGGLVAAGAEALGGAAAVGALVAGGELVAGAALAGYGIYQGYKALGGTSIGQQFDNDSRTLKSQVDSFISWGEKLFNP